MQYLHPTINIQKISILASTQYALEVTPDCPAYLERGLIFEGQTAIFCSDSESSGNIFSATLICSNIDGEFTLSTGPIVEGGGLTCPEGESSFTQSFTIEPDLPSDCVIDQVIVDLDNNTVDACDFVG